MKEQDSLQPKSNIHIVGTFLSNGRNFLKAAVYNNEGQCTILDIPCGIGEAMAAEALMEIVEKQIQMSVPELLA